MEKSSKSSSYKMVKVEAFLRLFAMITLALAAIVLAFDNQTVMVFGVVAKKATFNCSKIYVIFIYLHAICAGYNLAQLVRCLYSYKFSTKLPELTGSSHFLKWTYFVVDQMAVYMIFAINCAATEFSLFALAGEEELQWMKLCNRFTRFCLQVGGSLLCGFVASIILAVISGISTFNLFRWYSPNFLCLKPKRICVVANTNS